MTESVIDGNELFAKPYNFSSFNKNNILFLCFNHPFFIISKQISLCGKIL